PNPATASVDIPNVGQYKIGEGWIQDDNYGYARDMSGNWTFTMYVYCDDDIINGQLFAKVFDGFNNRLNSAQNRSQLIGSCSDPNAPKEIIWNDVLDLEQASSFVEGERFRVEIWFDANSGGTTGSTRTASSEDAPLSQTIDGSYIDTLAGNEGGTQYEHLREVGIPCGNVTNFDVVSENGIEGMSVSGDFASLAVNDQIFEEIGEANNPNSLEWIWNIDIIPGTGQYSFYLDAVIGLAPLNDDNFTVEYSTTGAFAGEEQTMFTVDGTWVGSFSDPPPARYDFPGGALTGVSTVYIRATDTNLTDWPQLVDVLKVDRMYIQFVESTSNCSALEHIWVIDDIPSAVLHEIYLNGHHSPSVDGDDFHFSYSSISSLGPYIAMFTLTNTTDTDYYHTSSVSGPPGFTTLWVRAVDTDRTPDPAPPMDDLYVDHIYLETSGGGNPFQLHLIFDNSTYASGITTVEDSAADTSKPTSVVLSLPLYSELIFNVHFLASDIGSGVHHVELWYILDNDTHIRYLGAFTISPITFTAPGDGRYRFYTRAIDWALNYEDRPAMFDAVTTVDSIPPSVIDVSPDDSSTGVSRDPSIKVRFSESMNSLWVEYAFSLIEDGNGRVWTIEEGSASWNHPVNDTFTFRLPEGEELKWGTEYTIIIERNARDGAGNMIESEFRSTFVTEEQFNPAMLVLIIVIAVILMIFLFYFILVRKKPEEEVDSTPETVPVQPGEYPDQQLETPPTQFTPYVPPPSYAGPPPSEPGAAPLWESERPVEELWRTDASDLSACANCGRFSPESSSFCPFCGVRLK
ncbi:MAG: Ig-like domain-containing protein, partial [Thermoplasmata archaeon]|nr:Ig-like domain-containing protein [Thermoplasmata archaeon]